MTNIPYWKSEFIFVKQTLISDARPTLITDFPHGQGTFAYPYPTKPFDEMSFSNFMKKPGQTPTFSARPMGQPINVGSPSVSRLKAVDDNDQERGVNVDGGSKKRHSIIAALEEDANVIKLVVVGSSSKPEPKKRKHEGLRRTSTRGSIPPP
ncbi:hypothetical protein Tco_1557262, partial [Tanacetum coccineum]